jgi:hypothetical protein
MLLSNHHSMLCNISESADITLPIGVAGRGLALRGPVQSSLVQRSPVQCFICKFKMTSHI